MRFLTFLILISVNSIIAQVGIGTTTPNATLDVIASNQATPSFSDGLLIPRIDAFPATNPTSSQQGMLVYLTTTVGAYKEGFYYWDNPLLSWMSLVGQTGIIDDDGDTKIQVEESSDEDMIRFDVAGTEYFRMESGRIETSNNGESVFIGENAGANDDHSANQNVAIGYHALQNNTTGSNNTAIGFDTMQANTTGSYNTVVGFESMQSNTTGNNNVAIGRRGLYNNTTGNNNVAVGREVMLANTTGILNVAMGYRALNSNTTGSHNYAIGATALGSNTTGSYNYAIGPGTLNDNTTGGRNTAIGLYALRRNTTGVHNIGIGATSLHSNTTGSYNSAFGPGALYSNTTGTDNIGIGDSSLRSNTTGSYNTGIGLYAMQNNTTAHYNIGIGFSALRYNTIGVDNVAIGHNALINSTTGKNSVAIGAYTLTNNTTGAWNTASGHGALEKNTTGVNNVGIGPYAMGDNETGDHNVAIGASAGDNRSSSSTNVFIGRLSGGNGSGSGNVLLGNESGYGQSMDNKLFIDNSNTSSPLVWGDFNTDEIVINGSLGVAGNYVFPTIDGTIGQILATDGSGTVSWSNVSINDADADTTNELNNTVVLIGTDLEVTDAGGTITTDLSSLKVINELTDLDKDTKIQVEESSDEDVIRFDIGGTEHFVMKSGRLDVLNTGKSVFVGYEAGLNDDFSSNSNTGIGEAVLKHTTTGAYNTAVGNAAMQSNITGSNNVALGMFSLQSNLDGYDNIAIGRSAMSFGKNSYGNVAIGRATLANINSGYQNVAIGREAGFSNSSGSGNVFLGYQSGYSETGSNKLYIDNSDSSTPLIWGDFDTDNLIVYGSLGIQGNYTFPTIDGLNGQFLSTDGSGTVSWSTLSVNDADADTTNELNSAVVLNGTDLEITDAGGTITTDLSALTSSDNLGNHTALQNIQTNGNWLSNDGDNEGVFVDGTGKVGIGKGVPSGKLHVYDNQETAITIQSSSSNTDPTGIAFQNFGSWYQWGIHRDNGSDLVISGGNITAAVSGLTEQMRFTANGIGIQNNAPNVALDVIGDIEYTGTITDVSDRRLKEDLKPIKNVLERIKQLNGYSYNMIGDTLKQREYGVIAQDVQQVFPEMVKKIDSQEDYLGVSYIQFTPVLLEAIKEQQKLIENQKTKVEEQNQLIKLLLEQNKLLKSNVDSNNIEIQKIKNRIE